jgi:hypothetical protein
VQDTSYSPPEDIFAPNNNEQVVWGYPLDLADWQTYIVAHRPWRMPGETQSVYVTRVASMYPDATAQEIARWFDHATLYPV